MTVFAPWSSYFFFIVLIPPQTIIGLYEGRAGYYLKKGAGSGGVTRNKTKLAT